MLRGSQQAQPATSGDLTRAQRADATRELILTTAERLFAEHGLSSVSNRQIGEAAGQGNNTVVVYHFGSKIDLIRAILRQHAAQVRPLYSRVLADTAASAELSAWVRCVVRPFTMHLDMLGSPTWFARFLAQATTVPAVRDIAMAEWFEAIPMLPVVEHVIELLPDLPTEVWLERNDMARLLMVHVCAEREHALAEGHATHRPSWLDVEATLVDAIVAILRTPARR